jgi:hypothetical protein
LFTFAKLFLRCLISKSLISFQPNLNRQQPLAIGCITHCRRRLESKEICTRFILSIEVIDTVLPNGLQCRSLLILRPILQAKVLKAVSWFTSSLVTVDLNLEQYCFFSLEVALTLLCSESIQSVIFDIPELLVRLIELTLSTPNRKGFNCAFSANENMIIATAIVRLAPSDE